MLPIKLAVLRDGRRGVVISVWEPEEMGSDIMGEVLIGTPESGDSILVAMGDVYVFELSARGIRPVWRPVDAEGSAEPGWTLLSSLRIHIRDILSFPLGGGLRAGGNYILDSSGDEGPELGQVDAAILDAEMLGLRDIYLYVSPHVDVDAALGGWAELVESDGTGRLSPPGPTLAPAPAAEAEAPHQFTTWTPAVRAIDSIVPDWAIPDLTYALGGVNEQTWAESVLSPVDTLRALAFCAPADIRMVILGQDPYPTPGKANGLAFGLSSKFILERGEACLDSSSFGNIHRELAACGFDLRDWTLESLAREGVLLLNTRLSCAPNKPKSHFDAKWGPVVSAILSQVPNTAAWIAWGSEARALAERFAPPLRIVATSHPMRNSATRGSFLAPAFVGSRCFERANDKLVAAGIKPVVFGNTESANQLLAQLARV